MKPRYAKRRTKTVHPWTDPAPVIRTVARKRQPTQLLNSAWPFLLTVVPGRGIVQNVPAPPRERRLVTKPKKTTR